MKTAAARKAYRLEKQRHYRLMHRVYRLCTAGGWSLRFARIHDDPKACKALGLVNDDGSAKSRTVGAADRKTKILYLDFRFDVIATFLHECLHILFDHRFLAHESEKEEQVVQETEALMLRHLSPLQAKRLHALILDMLKADPAVTQALDESDGDIEVECLVEGIE